MRFRRKAKLFPGVYLNFSKSGISTTIGVPGASINFNKQGTFLNTGIPGTGIYDRKKIGGKKLKTENSNYTDVETPAINIKELEPTEIRTKNAEATTTDNLQELKKTLLECYNEKNSLKREIISAKSKLTFSLVILVISYILIFGIFIKWFKNNHLEKKEFLIDLKSQLENCFINIDMEVDDEIDRKFNLLLENYKTLLTSQKIWDITSSVSVNQKATRSAAAKSVTRKLVKFGYGNVDFLKSKYDALHFENANGGDIYIYPAFIAIVNQSKKFGLVDIRELNFDFHGQKFIEEEKVPADAKIIGSTWAKVNKNGSRDKRFKDNYEIPICLYGDIEITSNTGLNEAYSLSSYEKAEKFSQSMIDYQNAIR